MLRQKATEPGWLQHSEFECGCDWRFPADLRSLQDTVCSFQMALMIILKKAPTYWRPYMLVLINLEAFRMISVNGCGWLHNVAHVSSDFKQSVSRCILMRWLFGSWNKAATVTCWKKQMTPFLWFKHQRRKGTFCQTGIYLPMLIGFGADLCFANVDKKVHQRDEIWLWMWLAWVLDQCH